jgi:serine/threonine protein kinase
MNAFVCLFRIFRAGDRLASVLRPHQLLEMRIGECEMRYSEAGNDGKGDVFRSAWDLISGCLKEAPVERLSCRQALEHEFVSRKDLEPEEGDLELLPTKVIMIMEGIRRGMRGGKGGGGDGEEEEENEEDEEEFRGEMESRELRLGCAFWVLQAVSRNGMRFPCAYLISLSRQATAMF